MGGEEHDLENGKWGNGKSQSTVFQRMLRAQRGRVHSDVFATSMMLECNVLVKHTRASQVVQSEERYVENGEWEVEKSNQPHFKAC